MTRGKRIITAKHYEGVGEIVCTWARLETHIFRTFEHLLAINTMQSLALFWEMAFRQRLDRLKALVALKWRTPNDVRLKEFYNLLEQIDASYTIRNAVAHSVWKKGNIPDAIIALYINAKGGKIPRTTNERFPLAAREFTPTRLHDEAIKIYNLAEAYKSFATVHFGVKFFHTSGDDSFD